MDENQIVRVVNRDDTDFVDRFDGRGYEIPAGGSKHVPIGAVSTWLGNPTVTGSDRQREVEQLQIRYGLSVRDLDDATTRSFPDLEVYDDEDNRIYFPADDPTGTAGYPVLDAPVAEVSMSDLQRQLAYLQTQIDAKASGRNVVTSASTEGEDALAKLPKDTPQQQPRGHKSPAKKSAAKK